jgi:phage shock protein A
MTQKKDQLAEATIGALANLATATASDRCVVAALTQASSRLAKPLEETSSELRELKALLNQERCDKRGPRVSTHLQAITAGLMVTRSVRRIQVLIATTPPPPPNPATKQRTLGPTTWEAIKPTRNDV